MTFFPPSTTALPSAPVVPAFSDLRAVLISLFHAGIDIPLDVLDTEDHDRVLALLDEVCASLSANLDVARRLDVADFRTRVLRFLLDGAHRKLHAQTDTARTTVRHLVHDTSNLLSAVCGNLEFVERAGGMLPAPTKEALSDAAEAGRALQDVISRTGDLMALEQQRVMPAKTVRLDAFIRSLKLPAAVAVMQAASPTTAVLVRDVVLMRAVRFLCARAQLAGNARMLVDLKNGALLITISDEGPPVPDEVRRLMLTRAWRGEQAAGVRAEHTHGYHLALLVARAHDGTLSLEGGAERGLVVKLVLPQPL